MKRQILKLMLFAVISAFVISCDDDKIVGELELPQTSRTFLSTHFSGINILRISKDANNYSVHLSNQIEVDFNINGEWIEVDGADGVVIPTTYILPQILAYVEDNYPQDALNSIEKKNNGFDVDLLRQDIDLVFDQLGGFVRTDP